MRKIAVVKHGIDNASGFNKPEIVAILRKHVGKSSGNFFGK